MIQELTNLVVADNTGAKRAMCFRILKQRKEYAHLGDVIRVAIKEASPTGSIRKELFELKLKQASKVDVEKPVRMRLLRREIARMLTVQAVAKKEAK